MVTPPARRPRRACARRRRGAAHLALPRSRARDRARHRRRRAARPAPRATPRSTTRTTATGSSGTARAPRRSTSPLVRVVYDLVFGYEHGDDDAPAVRRRHRSAALGEDVLRLPRRDLLEDDRGHGRRRLRAALRRAARPRRGVRVLPSRRPPAARAPTGNAIDAVDLGRAGTLADGRGSYEPLVDVGGLPCWPAAPRRRAARSRTAGTDRTTLESHWCTAAGRGHVIAAPRARTSTGGARDPASACTRTICGELIENPRTPEWRAMTEHVGTVATQAVQLWLTGRRADARLARARMSPRAGTRRVPHLRIDVAAARRRAVAGRRPPRVDRLLLPRARDAPSRRPPTTSSTRARARSASRARRGRVPPPTTCATSGRHGRRDGDFRWDLLCGDDGDAAARDAPRRTVPACRTSTRRTATCCRSPGTGRYRLRADESGYDNLVLAGDWTDSGLNAGCIEAAVVSGIQAANAVTRPSAPPAGRGLLPHAQRAGDRPGPGRGPTTSDRP